MNVRPRQIDFQFDEVVAQQALGATDLSRLFLISPRDGDPDISWHRSRVTVKPRRPFHANTAYVVTMLPGLADLRGNVRKEGASVIFATGPTVPRYGIVGTVFDWGAQRVAPNAYVEALPKSDTSIAFVAVADSAGHFEIGPLDTGRFIVRGLIDQNSNRKIDRNEKWDTVSVAVTTAGRPSTELDAIERDSTPALLTNITVEDSVTLRLAFDKYLDPTMPLQPALVQIVAADSSHMAVQRVEWAAGFDAAKRAADSVRRADSTRRADSLARASGRAPPAPAVAPRPALPVGVPGARPAPPPAKPKTLAPDRAVIVTLSPIAPIVPNRSYRVTVRGFRNLLGHAVQQTRPFQAPPPKPPPKDTTKRDTTVRGRPDTTRTVRPPPTPGRPPL